MKLIISSVYKFCHGECKYIPRCHYRRRTIIFVLTALVCLTLIWFLSRINYNVTIQNKSKDQQAAAFLNKVSNMGVNNSGIWDEIQSRSAVYSITGRRPTQEDRYTETQEPRFIFKFTEISFVLQVCFNRGH